MAREELVMLELTPEELLVISLQGVIAKLTLKHQLESLTNTELELGRTAAHELIKHLGAASSLTDKITRVAATHCMGEQFV